MLGTIWAFQTSHAPKPINTNENKSAQNMFSLSLAGWALVATAAEEVRGPHAAAQLAVPQAPHTVTSFNYTDNSFEGSSFTQSGFLTSGRRPESCSFCRHIRDLSLSQECYRKFALLATCGSVAWGGSSRPFSSSVEQNLYRRCSGLSLVSVVVQGAGRGRFGFNEWTVSSQ